MTAGRPSRGGRAASCRAAIAALVVLGVLLLAASGAFAQPEPPTTTTAATTTTTTTRPPPPGPPPTTPPTTAPPTTQETAPPATEESPPPADSDVEPVVDEEEPVEEEAAAEAYDARGITFTTVNNLLVPGDGTEGAQATTTTTAPQPDEGSSADDENRLIWMIIAGLAAVAVIVAVLTWRYWLLTRPGLVLEGEEADDDVRRAGTGPGYGDVPSGQRSPPGGRGGNDDAFWDEPRDPRRAFVGPPDAGGVPTPPPGSGAPLPGRQDPGAGRGGARRRPGPGAPGGPGGPARQGGPVEQGGRRGPPSSRSAWPGAPGQGDPKRRRRNPGAGPPQGPGGPQAAGERRRRSQPSQPGQPGAGSAAWVNDVGPAGAHRVVGQASGGGRTQPPARPQPLAGRSMRDTDVWAPDRRR